MDVNTLYYTIVSVVGGILIGVIAYFLKRTMALLDRCETDIRGKVGEKEFSAFQEATNQQLKAITGEIKCIQQDYITKEDFFREQAKSERKLDMILDILLGRKGQNG